MMGKQLQNKGIISATNSSPTIPCEWPFCQSVQPMLASICRLPVWWYLGNYSGILGYVMILIFFILYIISSHLGKMYVYFVILCRFWFRRRIAPTEWDRGTWSMSTTWWPGAPPMTTCGKSIKDNTG